MDNLTQKIIPVLKKYNIKKAALFGSYARGEQTKKSDIDILITPPKSMDLIEFVGVKQDLEDTLKKKVDLVSYRAIKPELKDSILADEKLLYEAK